MSEPPLHVLFLVRSLERGGGERQLVGLARGLARRGARVSVAVMYGGGALESDLATSPVTLVNLRKQGRWDGPGFLRRLITAARDLSPHVVYGFMSGANELALLAGWATRARVVWGVRSSFVNFGFYDWMHDAMFRLGRRLSSRPELIVANSYAGRAHCIAAGYDGRRMIVIPNGIDTEHWRPDPAAGAAFRQGWGIPAGAMLVGLVGRIEPMKGHATFLEAVQRSRVEGLHAVCIGRGEPAAVQALRADIERLDLQERVRLVDEVENMRAAYSALNVLVSASLGEGFSNVVGEAMSCGVPCVVTKVGDSASIVGAFGEVAPPENSSALALAIERLLVRSDRALAMACRQRIETEFGIERLVDRTLEQLVSLR